MRKVVLAAVLVLMASGAQAATLNVIGGQLMGASDVLVDGSLYDVLFLDGSCIDLYNGCDEASDFTFQTQASATLAAQALLDQVFLDGVEGQFDSDPTLTNGCSLHPFPTECSAFTPWVIFPAYLTIYVGAASNAPFTAEPQWVDNAAMQMALSDEDLGLDTTDVYAVWSPVPEPSTALLLGIGLTGLAAKGRRRS